MVKIPSGGVATAIDPDVVARTNSLSTGSRTVIRWQGGQPVGIRNAWMGPGAAPDVGVFESGLPTRQWDYPSQWNMRRSPESGKAQDSQGTNFGILRALADQTHVRLINETVKNQQSARKWTYTLKAAPGEALNETKKRTGKDPRITKIYEFFEQPDGKHDWPDWLRLLLEEVNVCDNLSMLRRDYEFNTAREPYSIEVIDGDTIQVLSDLAGREPEPPDTAFTQWIKGAVFRKFTAPVDRSKPTAAGVLAELSRIEIDFRPEELMYLPRNLRVKHFYGFSPVEQLLFYINLIMRRDLTKLYAYTEGNIPAGFLPIAVDWQPKQLDDFQKWLDLKLSGDQANRSRVIAVPGGARNVDWAQKDILSDRFDDDWIRLVCFCFDVSSASFIQHQNKSTSDNAKHQAEEDSSGLTAFVGRVQNYIIRKWFGYSDIIAVEEQQMLRDAEKQQKVDAGNLASGIVQPNEIRRRNGDEEYPELVGVNGQVIPTLGFVPFPTQEETAATRQRSIDGPPPPVAATAPGEKPDTEGQPNVIAAKAYKLASTQVNITGDTAAAILDLAASIPDDALSGKGRETQPHVTVKYGIDPAVTAADVRAAIGSKAEGTLTFGVTAFFPAEDHDVVVLTVDSPDLDDMSEAIASGVTTQETQPNYVPHATIAHVESGRGHEFAGIGTMVGVEHKFSAVHFMDTEGNATKLQTVKGHLRVRQASKAQKKSLESRYASRTSTQSSVRY